MARFKKARKFSDKAKKYYRRHRGFGGGVLSKAVHGGIIGAAATFGAPWINQYVPPVGPVRPSTLTVLGGGILAKSVLHKGGGFSDAAVIIGAAMLAGDLMAGMSSGGVAGGGAY